MNKTLQLLLLFTVTIFLWGCPYDSPYGIDSVEKQDIDENLIGSWATIMTKPSDDKHVVEDPVKIIFSKNTGLEYNIAITGKIDELRPYHMVTNDSIKGTAYLSTVAGKQFLNAFIKGKMYIAEINNDTAGLTIRCLSEHFTGKYIKSSIELRMAVELHYKFSASPAYDDYFVFKNLQKVN